MAMVKARRWDGEMVTLRIGAPAERLDVIVDTGTRIVAVYIGYKHVVIETLCSWDSVSSQYMLASRDDWSAISAYCDAAVAARAARVLGV